MSTSEAAVARRPARAAKKRGHRAAGPTQKARGRRTAAASVEPAVEAKPSRVKATAQGALANVGTIADLVAEATQNTLAANPLIGLRRRDIAVAAGSMLSESDLAEESVPQLRQA